MNFPPLEQESIEINYTVKRKRFGLLRKYSRNASYVVSEKASTRGWVGTQIFAEAVMLDAL